MKKIFLIITGIFFCVLGIFLHVYSGIFSGYGSMDLRDQKKWKFDENGIILKADTFPVLRGTNTWWFLIYIPLHQMNTGVFQ